MLAGLSAFDPMPYIEAYPSLKYFFALGAMVLTLRGIAGSWRKLNAGEDQAPAPVQPAQNYDLARLERKVDHLGWNMAEARREIHDLIEVVRPGGARPRQMPNFSGDNGG